MMDDVMDKVKNLLNDTLTKMPKDTMQKLLWVGEKQEEYYQELLHSGLDTLTIIGTLECLKNRFLKLDDNTRTVMEKVMK